MNLFFFHFAFGGCYGTAANVDDLLVLFYKIVMLTNMYVYTNTLYSDRLS